MSSWSTFQQAALRRPPAFVRTAELDLGACGVRVRREPEPSLGVRHPSRRVGKELQLRGLGVLDRSATAARGHCAYQRRMDRDNDGWACERVRRSGSQQLQQPPASSRFDAPGNTRPAGRQVEQGRGGLLMAPSGRRRLFAALGRSVSCAIAIPRGRGGSAMADAPSAPQARRSCASDSTLVVRDPAGRPRGPPHPRLAGVGADAPSAPGRHNQPRAVRRG